MKIIETIEIKIRTGSMPDLMGEIYGNSCILQKAEHITRDGEYDIYNLDIVYSSNEKFESLINKIKSFPKNFVLIKISNTLEELIQGGMIRISGKMDILSQSDFDMKVLGSTHLLAEKIKRGKENEYSGIYKSIGLAAAVMNSETNNHHIYESHAEAEQDSIIINRFCGLNAYPLVLKFSYIEDLIKNLQALESSFCMFRMMKIHNNDDYSLYEQIYDDISIPVLSTHYDEIPICILVEIIQLMKKYRLAYQDSNIGIIGINESSVRMTRLLQKIGIFRVLGYDNNEKLMLGFEKNGGLATTPENIFNNSDLVILFKNHFTIDEFNKIRAGQIIISLIDEDDMEMAIIGEKSVREYVGRDFLNLNLFFPGILSGMHENDINSVDDDRLIEIAEKIYKMKSQAPEQFNLFGNIHSKISRMFA